jgi:DNA topoisomerase-6 subunit B
MEDRTNMLNVKETGEQAKRRAVTVESMAARQCEISVSEFFAKNRHLLGFDNPGKLS